MGKSETTTESEVLRKHRKFLSEAEAAAHNSNCIRRNVGAVIVQQGVIAARGWNGLLEDDKNCREAGCPRCIKGGDTGTDYDYCACIHAEQRAVAQAAKLGIKLDDSAMYVNLRPCLQCLLIVFAAGIRRVYYGGAIWTYPREVEAVYENVAGKFDVFCRMAEEPGVAENGSLTRQ